ncbi:uncharacterized protein LOC105427251 [Pogonomyrmex barbatus]|uniref:Uncharacterized protein LOC105427251 n=1 Tax=Pogonomyrmex barbatus TaxID=144034 RepID=A0A6I9W5G1_9HYME|nr:uncharacterized protein LOC105427251 [Pogonomyrmex barbatus]
MILDTDASGFGIGAILSQVQDGYERVIAYYSRVLNKPERNYCTIRRELLALVESVKHFHHYLYGKSFSIRTDHASLRWLMSFKDLKGQLARWTERLQQYDFDVAYRKGIIHDKADGLSRRPSAEEKCKFCTKVEVQRGLSEDKVVARIVLRKDSSEDWRKAQIEDQELAMFLLAKENDLRPSWEEVSSKGLKVGFFFNGEALRESVGFLLYPELLLRVTERRTSPKLHPSRKFRAAARSSSLFFLSP